MKILKFFSSPSQPRLRSHLEMAQSVFWWLSIPYLQRAARLSGSCVLQIPPSEVLRKRKSSSLATDRLRIWSRSSRRRPASLVLSAGHRIMLKRVTSRSHQPLVNQLFETHQIVIILPSCQKKKKKKGYRLVFSIVWGPSFYIISAEDEEKNSMSGWSNDLSCGPGRC